MEKLHLHFALHEHDQNKEYFIQGHGKKQKLQAYADNPQAFEAHKKVNPALALIPQTHQHMITHFIEDIELPDHKISRISVVTPSQKKDDILPDLVSVHIHVPTHRHKKALKKAMATSTTPHPLVLNYLGIGAHATTAAVNTAAQVDVKAAAAQIVLPPLAIAQTIVFHHPEIGSINTDTTGDLYTKYMQDHNTFTQLYEYISNNPDTSSNPWYKKACAIKVDPTTLKESPMPADDTRTYADGKPIDWPTDSTTGQKVIPQYQLSDDDTGAADGGVMAAAKSAVFAVLKQTKNDAAFSGSLWTRSHASISQKKSVITPTNGVKTNGTTPQVKKAAVAAVAETAEYWSAKYDSDRQYGLDLYADQLEFENNTLGLPVKNWPARCLSVYIEYQMEDGTPIPWSVLKNAKEADDLIQSEGFISPAFAAVFAKRNDDTTKLFWGILDEGNNVFGIPFFTNATNIEFQWPHDKDTGEALASRAEIYIGGLGVANGFSDWDTDVDLAGVIATGLLTYGFTAAFMVFDVAVLSPLKKKMMKSDVKYAVLTMAGLLGVTAVIVSGAFWQTGRAKSVLTKISNFVASFIFGKAGEFVLEKIYEDAIEEMIAEAATTITAEEALEQIPFAGWALRVIDLAGDIAALAATTIECIASPATYKLQIEESMDLAVTVSPDPAHGTAQQKPIWPLVADHWVTVLKYPKNGKFEGGTTYVQSGPMPGQHDAPINISFEKVPAGGQIEITTTIYSSSDWIAGQWSSGPKSATPDENGKLEYSGAIIENLVPLTPTVTYSEKQRVGFDPGSQKHVWVVTSFAIDGKFKTDLDAGKLSADFYTAFAGNGVQLGGDGNVSVTTVNAGTSWKVSDKTSNNTYQCSYRSIYSSDNETKCEITVQNSSRPAPPLPNPKLVCDTSGNNHNLCELVDVTIDNRAYQLGYAWRASGMNMPLDKPTSPVENTQMYTLQSISTLNEPSDLIVQSSIGFSQMPFIAYNQFGLTPLFSIDGATYATELNGADEEAVPQAVLKTFTDKGFTIPAGALIKVIKPNVEWRLMDASRTVLFDLLYDTKPVNGNAQGVINIFNYVIPSTSNFYMDPRPGPNGYYHLRAVSFNDGVPGSYQFTTDFKDTDANSWGAFPIPNGSSIYQVAIHPSGFAVAIDYGLDKLWTLKLPEAATTMTAAPLAMPLAGSGALEGLVSQPKAMTIATDGRIIILEQGNSRFQSLDIKGNPVAAFKGPLTTTIPASFATDLNNGIVSAELLKVYQAQVPVTYFRASMFTSGDQDTMPLDGITADLDNGTVSADLIQFCKNHALILSATPGDLTAVVNVSGSAWLLTDGSSNVTYDIRWDDDMYELVVYYAANLQIDVITPGIEWKIADRVNSLTFEVKPGNESTDPLQVQQLISTAALRPQPGKTIEYLDIATEDKGYIYVLYFENEGTSAAQYMLDIYNPDGTVLLNKPLTGLAAAKMSVDQWRTLWTLNYETFLGPNNRTEPTVSGWIPSTPDGPSSN